MNEFHRTRKLPWLQLLGMGICLFVVLPLLVHGQGAGTPTKKGTGGPPPLVSNPTPKKDGDMPDSKTIDTSSDSTKKDPDISIPLGEIFKLRPESKLPVADVVIDREKVLKLIPFDKKAQFIKIIPVGLGEAKVTLIDTKGDDKTYRVRVTPSISFLEHLIQRQYPQSHLKLAAVGDNVIFVEGEVDAPSHVDEIVGLLQSVIGKDGRVVNNIRQGGVMQVQLSICIARVDRLQLRKLNANFLAANSHGFVGTQIGNLLGLPNITPRAGSVLNAATQNQLLSPNSTVFFGVTSESSALFGFIEFLKQQSVAKVLANPTLVTMNGRPADFLVGGEQPIPTVILAGSGAVPNVQFKPFGTRLTFVPVRLGDGKIRLDVLPEVSTIDSAGGILTGGITVPRFIVQRLHTTVEMESGQTLYLGGLLQNELAADVQKIPWLGDLPGVGALFRKVSHQYTETELVVIVTPKLVSPMREHQKPVCLPGQESRDPSDHELYLKGRIEVAPPPPPHSQHHQNWTYPPPPGPLPTSGPTEVQPGPLFGPFGPGNNLLPQKNSNNGGAELRPGTLFGPFGPVHGSSVIAPIVPATQSRTGTAAGSNNVPVVTDRYGTTEALPRPMPIILP